MKTNLKVGDTKNAKGHVEPKIKQLKANFILVLAMFLFAGLQACNRDEIKSPEQANASENKSSKDVWDDFKLPETKPYKISLEEFKEQFLSAKAIRESFDFVEGLYSDEEVNNNMTFKISENIRFFKDKAYIGYTDSDFEKELKKEQGNLNSLESRAPHWQDHLLANDDTNYNPFRRYQKPCPPQTKRITGTSRQAVERKYSDLMRKIMATYRPVTFHIEYIRIFGKVIGIEVIWWYTDC